MKTSCFLSLFVLLAGCVSMTDRKYAEGLAQEAHEASTIPCTDQCRHFWDTARDWAVHSPDVKHVDVEPRQINVMVQQGHCRANMTIDLHSDNLSVRAKSLPYGLMYARTCGPGFAQHAILDFRAKLTASRPSADTY